MTKEGLTKKASAEVRIKVPEEVVEAVLDALSPEVESPSSERSSTDVRRGVDGIVISTEASDTTAMRAAVNSYLRWVQGILDMLSKIE
ncbi:MAG TPA: KEOPS complex subunit Pcc1 [Candidatus Krumholzibacteriaceae bacterium]|nr:KEOPS complex subunit Pcc1 [Candidatus Krumholzibacteriaceae bacterium]